MNTEEKETLEKLIAEVDRATHCALTAIGATSAPSSDADSAKAVLRLVKARAALVAEYIMLTEAENDE